MDDHTCWAKPGLPQAAVAAVEEGDPAQALALYENAIARGVRDPRTLLDYGVLLWRLYEFHRGHDVFSKILHDSQADPQLLRRVAQCYFEVGRFSDAADVMRVAVERQIPPDAMTLNTLAWTLERDHQLAIAREQAERALGIDATYGPAVRLLAHLDRRAEDFDGAARRLRQHLQAYPGAFDWGLRYELAAVLDRLGEFDEAWNALQLAKEPLTTTAAIHLRHSYQIRARQWALARRVTDVDLRRWKGTGDELGVPRRICFLTGFPRSGTTLLEQMIAANPQAVDTDESGILPAQFLVPLIWNAPDTADAIVEIRSFDADQLLAGRETFWRLTENYLGRAIGDRLLVEKNPLLTADLPFPLRLFPEASLIITLRDPRDVVLSYLFTMVPLNWSSAPAINAGEAGRFYAETMRHWLLWRDRLPWPARETRYEQMIADARAETEQMAKFLGITWHAAMLDERQRAERRAVRTPTYHDITRPLYSRAVGRWRNYERHLQPALSALAPFVKAFGYDE